MSKVVVIGGGAAGMMASIIAARNGHTVTLIEKNDKLGKKLFITGKGRCNFTNAGDEDDIKNSVVTNPKFMYSSFKGFSNYDVMGFFDELGLKFKIERGNRCFPESDHSSDVIGALARELRKCKVDIMLNTEVVDVTAKELAENIVSENAAGNTKNAVGNIAANNTENVVSGKIVSCNTVSENTANGNAKLEKKHKSKKKEPKSKKKEPEYISQFASVEVKDLSTGRKQVIKADSCIIATGGNSYSSTGSTGDGYRFAKALSHNVTPIIPALVPLTVREEWASELMGLSLKNIAISIYDSMGDSRKELYSDFGEMLFTHFGVSGPVILSASSYTTAILRKRPLKLVIDLKPALSEEQLDERVLRDFSEEKNKTFRNSLDKLLPKKLIPVIVRLSDINKDKQVNEITREERLRLVHLLKHFEMTITGTRGFNEAIITQGGVDVKEINPATMESKLVKNVYFAGEVLDVDAVTGGFNLQVAWSSAYAAAMHLND